MISASGCDSLRGTDAGGVFPAACLLGQVSVPFDLVKKHPKGQQTFALQTKDGAVGSLTTEVRTAVLSPTRTLAAFPFALEFTSNLAEQGLTRFYKNYGLNLEQKNLTAQNFRNTAFIYFIIIFF